MGSLDSPGTRPSARPVMSPAITAADRNAALHTSQRRRRSAPCMATRSAANARNGGMGLVAKSATAAPVPDPNQPSIAALPRTWAASQSFTCPHSVA
jgi:hypothetical protein